MKNYGKLIIPILGIKINIKNEKENVVFKIHYI